MDKRHRKAKTQRKPKKDKKKKETPEVFVLPPDLLKKLGINIGHNSQQSADLSCDTSIQNGSIGNTTATSSTFLSTRISSESSILEIACLMKQSVFLSPTFVPSANVVSGELEIMSESYSEEANANTATGTQENQCTIDNITTASTFQSINTSGANAYHDIDEKETEVGLQTTVQYNDVSSDKSLLENSIDLNINDNMFMNRGDSISEPMLINYETPNFVVEYSEELCQGGQQITEAVPEVKVPIHNKINIISEEIIPLSKLKVFKHSLPNLTPVTVDAIISTKKIIVNNTMTNGTEDKDLNLHSVDMSTRPIEFNIGNNNLSFGSEDSISNEESSPIVLATCIPEDNVSLESINNNDVLVTNGYIQIPDIQANDVETFDNTTIKTPINIVTDETSVKNDYSSMQGEKHENVDTKFDLKPEGVEKMKNQDKDNEDKNPSEIMSIQDKKEDVDVKNIQKVSISSNLNKSNDKNEILNIDKVKELAALIQQVYKIKRPNKNQQSEKPKGKISKSKSNTTKIKSKVHIQGVEKPGGKDYKKNHSRRNSHKPEILKTYYRANANEKPRLNLNNFKNVSLVAASTGINIDHIDSKNHVNSTLVQEYCLCYDYGKLAFYEDDNIYEHLHFWQHNKANFDQEVIFSIYNDINVENTVELNDDVCIQESSEDDVSKICWTNDAILNDHLTMNVETNDEEPTVDTVDKLKYLDCNKIGTNICNQTNVDVGAVEDIIGNEIDILNKNIESKVSLLELPQNIEENLGNNATLPPKLDSQNRFEGAHTSVHGYMESEIPMEDVLIVAESDEMSTTNVEQAREQKAHTSVQETIPMEAAHTSVQETIPMEEASNVQEIPITNVEKVNTENISQTKEQLPELENNPTVVAHVASQNIEDVLEKNATQMTKSVPQNSSEEANTSLLKTIKLEIPMEEVSNDAHSYEIPITTQIEQVPQYSSEHTPLLETIKIEIPMEEVPNDAQVFEVPISTPVEHVTTENISQAIGQVPQAASDNIMTEKSGHEDTLVSNKKTEVKILKRRGRPPKLVVNDSPSPMKKNANIRCGLCDTLFSEAEWTEHVINDHHLIAWKAGESFDLDAPKLMKRLRRRLETGEYLICSICDKMQSRHINKFVTHVRGCLTKLEISSNSNRPKRGKTQIDTTSRNCGVCFQDVPTDTWFRHIGKEHNYLAWINGETPLDLDNKTAVHDHLLKIVRCADGLTCYKCGRVHRRGVNYLSHIKKCDGQKIFDRSVIDEGSEIINGSEEIPVMCGVCNDHEQIINWEEHLEKKHDYMAWKMGSKPLNLDDPVAVRNHLNKILKHQEGLICSKCGVAFKPALKYEKHIKSCDGKRNDSAVDSSFDKSMNDSTLKKEKKAARKSLKRMTIVKCCLCEEEMPNKDWLDHSGKKHNYMAWKEGDDPLDEDDAESVLDHLRDILHEIKILTCHKCGFQRKRANLYLTHIQSCQKEPTELNKFENVVCGVCKEEMIGKKWLEHIMNEHSYLAWREGSTPLDTEDDVAVRLHLNNISRSQCNGLTCYKCGTVKKYPKTFLDHVAACGSESSMNTSVSEGDTSLRVTLQDKVVTCGVCKDQVESVDWFEHIRKRHNYMAWLEGHAEIIASDTEMVYTHLTEIARATSGLICPKCGVKRKYAQAYINHVESCVEKVDSNVFNIDFLDKDEVQCAMCLEEMPPTAWRSHAMNKHYNVAWIVGGHAIDLNSPYVIEPYIKEYQREKKKLICKTCGVSRVSLVGFYAHIIQCGQTEEQLDVYKSTCSICNKKYLKIYKSQHMTAHKEAELKAERRLIIAEEKQMKKEELEERIQADLNVSGRRRAAEKAKNVIEKYKESLETGQYKCEKCRFATDIEAELHDHVCVISYSDSESDVSVNLDHCSTDLDSGDSDIDSNVSEQEREERDNETRKRSSDHHGSSASKLRRLPYPIKNASAYLRECGEQFCDTFLTEEDLFPQWRNFDYEVLSAEELTKYKPPIERSCQISFEPQPHGAINQLDRFECKSELGKPGLIAAFVGAYIQCVSWLPSQLTRGSQTMYFAVACHLSSDAPRYSWDETPHAPALLQIWRCQNKVTNMEFVLGIGHDYGAVWAMDWCPSGATDVESTQGRLGLLAIACSNGSAYILAVPFADYDQTDKIYCRLKPVAELRFLPANSSRKKCQATSIKWSSEKGHSHIVVGYSDGTVGYYDLTIESPMLKTYEDGVTILYPYNEDRGLNASIEAVDVYPGRHGRVCGAGGPGGAWAGGPDGARLLAHVSVPALAFPPHWPSAMLAGEDTIALQWIRSAECGGRRMCAGGGGAGGCVWCARAVVSAPPLLRTVRLQPAAEDPYKSIIATIQMFSLNPNKKRKANDTLSMIVEPFTYEEAAQKYGIEFVQITGRDKATQQKCRALPREVCPDRFPLSEVANMAFCPAPAHHQKLLISLRPGFIIIMTSYN